MPTNRQTDLTPFHRSQGSSCVIQPYPRRTTMAYYPDLSPCPYFGKKTADQLVAVGWLDNEHPYTKGNVSEAFVDKLIELLVDPWAPMYLLGYDECPFCGQSYSLTHKETTIDVGARNLFLPGEGFLYVAPSLIAHYI